MAIYPGAISRFGNSQGIRLPISVLQEANLYEDLSTAKGAKVPVKLEVTSESITIRRASVIPKITLEEIFKDWDGKPYELTDEDKAWLNMKPVGRELI